MEEKILIVGVERTGSTLLAALLSEAGGNFGIDESSDWNRNTGAYEHPLLMKASKYIGRFVRLKPISNSWARKQKHKAISVLSEVPCDVHILKYPPSSHLYPYFFREAGFSPKLLVTIRNFGDYFVSKNRKDGSSFKEVKDIYLDTYQTILAQLNLFDYLIVDYDQVMEQSDVSWMRPLANFTNLSESRLKEARGKLLKSRREYPVSVKDMECDSLYAQFRSLCMGEGH